MTNQMTTQEALDLLEHQVKTAADTDPSLKQAVQTLSVELEAGRAWQLNTEMLQEHLDDYRKLERLLVELDRLIGRILQAGGEG